MAERLNPRHQDMVRAKIKSSQLVNRLQDHAFGKIDLEPERVQSIRILLNKTLPDLKAIEHSGQVDGTHTVLFNPK